MSKVHPAWDKGKSLLITEARETSMQLRALVSAVDPDKLWVFAAMFVQALITYVQEKHPAHLVKTRLVVQALPAQTTARKPASSYRSPGRRDRDFSRLARKSRSDDPKISPLNSQSGVDLL